MLDALPPEQLHGIGVNGSVWVSNWDTSQVVEYDAATGEELNTLPVGDSPIEPVFAFGDVWTLDHHAGSVTRIDTETSTVAATIEFVNPGIGGPLTHGVAGGLMWVAAPNTPMVVGIDPETNEVAQTTEVSPECSPVVAAVADRIWLTDCDQNPVLDPVTLESVGRRGDLPPALNPTGEALVVDDRVWRANHDRDDVTSGLYAVDLRTFDVVDEFPLQDMRAAAVAYGFDSIWLGSEGTIFRIPATALTDR